MPSPNVQPGDVDVEIDECGTKLMETVREYGALYDKNLKDFKNRQMKENAWRAVSETVGLSIDDFKRRYNSNRTAFSRYLRSLKPPSGSGRDSIILKPEYEHLRWLIKHIKHRAYTTSNFQLPEGEVEEVDDEGNITMSQTTTTTSSTTSDIEEVATNSE